MRGLDIGAVLDPVAGPVEICRNLDAELHFAPAPASRSSSRGGTLLLHWALGHRAGYAVDGKPSLPRAPSARSAVGGSAALGAAPAAAATHGCLETGAALWSLLPALQKRWPDLDQDEIRLARQLAASTSSPCRRSTWLAELVARALANACRLLFPTRIVISGPLSRQSAALGIASTPCSAPRAPLDGFAMPDLAGVSASQLYEIHGAAAPLLGRAAEALLTEQA